MKVVSRKDNKLIANLIVDGGYKYVSKFTIEDDEGIRIAEYDSIEALYENWEDYKEHKEYWHIFGTNIMHSQEGFDELYDKRNKEIGNFFETEEETKKAVEKLKAWKRLKDNGLKFNRWIILEEPKTPHIKLAIEAEINVPDSPYDLNLLFGGEE